MTRIVDVHLNADGTITRGTDLFDGPPDTALRQILAETAQQAADSGEDAIVRAHRPDGKVSVINALRDGALRRPSVDPDAAARRVPIESATSWWRRQSRVKLIGAATVMVLAVGTVAVAAQGGDTPPAGDSVAAPAPLSRIAPDGWTTQVAWDVSPVGEFAPVPVPDQDRILFVTPQVTIRSVNANTGATLWESQPLDAAPTGAPVVDGATDGGFVAVKTRFGISVLPLASSGTHVASTTVPASATATLTSNGEGVLVADEGKPTSILATTGELLPLTVPPGHAVYEALDDDTAVVAPAEGPWSILSAVGNQSTVVTPTAPAGAVGAPHAVSSVRGVVVAWWNTADAHNRLVAFHDARTGAIMASASVPVAAIDDGLPTVVSEDRTLLSAGPVLANTDTDEATYTEGWKPSNATAGHVFGSLGTQRAGWAGQGAPTPLAEGSAVPWLISDTGAAVVLDQLGTTTRIAALRTGPSV
jgi:outer membrane protein assembly factor BamB